MPELIRGNETLYALVGKNLDFDSKITNWINSANSMERHQGNIDLKNFSNILGSMRLVKDDEEISLIRKSCEIAAAISHDFLIKLISSSSLTSLILPKMLEKFFKSILP